MEKQRQSRHRESDAEIRVGWKMGGLGMEVAAQVAAGAVLGWLYDRWRGTGTTGILGGSVIGIAVGLGNMIRGAVKLHRELERQNPTAGRGRPLVDEDGDDTDDWNNQ